MTVRCIHITGERSTVASFTSDSRLWVINKHQAWVTHLTARSFTIDAGPKFGREVGRPNSVQWMVIIRPWSAVINILVPSELAKFRSCRKCLWFWRFRLVYNGLALPSILISFTQEDGLNASKAHKKSVGDLSINHFWRRKISGRVHIPTMFDRLNKALANQRCGSQIRNRGGKYHPSGITLRCCSRGLPLLCQSSDVTSNVIF